MEAGKFLLCLDMSTPLIVQLLQDILFVLKKLLEKLLMLLGGREEAILCLI